MQNTSYLGLAISLGSGLMIRIQSTFFTLIGRAIGPALIGVIIDALGRAGGEAIRLYQRRVLGLIITAVAVVLLAPRR